MIKMFMLFAIAYSIILPLEAQVYDEYFLDYYTDEDVNLYPIASCDGDDGSVLMTGWIGRRTSATISKQMPFLCKFNNSGVVEWIHKYEMEDTSFHYMPTSIITTYPNNDIVIVGNARSSKVNLEPSQAFVIKADPEGEEIFSRTYDCVTIEGDAHNECYTFNVNDISRNLQNGVILAGYTKMESYSNRLGIVMIIDNDGIPITSHTKIIAHPEYDQSEVTAIATTYDGGENQLLLMKHSKNGFYGKNTSLIKLDYGFQTLWSKDIKPEEGNSYEPYDIATSSGWEKIYVLGTAHDENAYYDNYISQLTSNGTINWTKKYAHGPSITTPQNNYYAKLCIDQSDHLYVMGEDNIARPVVFKTTASGNLLWSKTYSDTSYSVHPTDLTFIHSPIFPNDQYLAMVGNGAPPEKLGDYAWKVGIRLNDGSTDCEHSNVNTQVTAVDYNAISYEPAIEHITPIHFTKSLEEHTINPTVEKCSPFAYFSEETEGLISIQKPAPKRFSVFPNPNHGRFTIDIPQTDLVVSSVITVYDITGKVINRMTMESPQTQLSISGLQKGTYLIRWTQGDETAVERVVVQ